MKIKSVKYLSGIFALPNRLRFHLSLIKYLLNKNRYPLFKLSNNGKGLVDTLRMLHKIKLRKIVKYCRSSYFSLSFPHWPSPAFDHMVSGGGLNITAAGTPLKQHIDNAILAITPKCLYSCAHCYEHYNLSDEEKIPAAKFTRIISLLQQYGVSIITLSGGEPMLRFNDMLEILRSADKSRSDFHLHTSGYDVTPEKVMKLRNAGLQAAGIGLDDIIASANDSFRGYHGAFKQSIKAIKCFQDAGIFTYINACISRHLIRSGDIYKFLEMMKDLRIGIVRWIEPKSCGSILNVNADYLLTSEDSELLRQIYIQYNTRPYFREYPLIVYDAFDEAPENLGCMMAGNSHFYINSTGEVQPCVFLPISFGNIMVEDFATIMEKMQNALPYPLHTECPSVQLNQAIRNKIRNGAHLPLPYKDIKHELNVLDTE